MFEPPTPPSTVILPVGIVIEPVIFTLPVNLCVSAKSSPNVVEPDEVAII